MGKFVKMNDKAKQKQKKKTDLRSLIVEYSIIGFVILFLGAGAIVLTINIIEFADDLIVTDAEKAEMQEKEARKRELEREYQQFIRDKKQTESIALILLNAHPNVRRAIEAKGLELYCGGFQNYTITFDNYYVYVNGYLNFREKLERLIENSYLYHLEYTGENISDRNNQGDRIARYFNFNDWTIDSEHRTLNNDSYRYIGSGVKDSRNCKATYNEPSNNPSTNSASKPKEPKLNAVPASKSIQEIRESVKNRTQDKDH